MRLQSRYFEFSTGWDPPLCLIASVAMGFAQKISHRTTCRAYQVRHTTKTGTEPGYPHGLPACYRKRFRIALNYFLRKAVAMGNEFRCLGTAASECRRST